jgi:tetratricopeptide (TPR) repeat protein
LSQALYRLKSLTADRSPLRGSRTSLHIENLASDYSTFIRSVGDQDWLEAEATFRGQLLEGIPLQGAEELTELIDRCRRDLVDMCADVWRGLQLDGRMTEAARLAERTSQPELTPFFHTSFAPDEAGLTRNADGSPVFERAPFVGRKAEMDALEPYFQAVSGSGFRTVVIGGEAGIGKTALAQRFSRLWALRGGAVLRASGFAAEKNVPFGAVAQWLRDVDRERLPTVENRWTCVIEEAFPGTIARAATSPVGDELRTSSEFRLLEALRFFFQEMSATRPLLLVLDDAQYGDATSIAFVHYFSRRSSSARVMFLAAVRTPSPDGDDPFEGWSAINRMVLGPLSIRDTTKLAARSCRIGPEPDLEAVAHLSRRTGGNPLLLTSLLAHTREIETTAVPDTIIEFFRPRLEALSNNAALVMASIAVIGDAADQQLAADIAGLGDDSAQMSSALSELRNAGLLMFELDDGLRPRHGIVADIAVNVISAADRRALYGRAARVLGEHGRSSPAVLAIQHDIAGDRTSAFAAALNAASASHELHAPREQEFFLKLALSNAPDKEAEVSIRIRLAELYRRIGRSPEALDVIADPTLIGASEVQRIRAQASRLAIRLAASDIRISLRTAWEEIEAVSGSLDPDLIAGLYLHFAVAGRDRGDRAPTVEAATRALSIAQGLPTTSQTVITAVRAANILGLWGDAPGCLETIRTLLAREKSNAEVLGQCLSAEASLLVCMGRLIEAEGKFLQAMELIERCCMYDALFALHNNLGVCYTELGRYGEAQQQLEKAARVGDELGRQRSTVAAENLAMLHLERGEYELALRTVRGAMTKATTRSPRELFHRHALIGLSSLELGLLAQAFEAKREIDLLFQQHEYWGSDVSYVEMFLARMLVMEGRPEMARERLEAAVEIYRPRDLMSRARLELELVRLELKTHPTKALERAEAMLETLRGTGARPLVDRFEELADRARRHAG